MWHRSKLLAGSLGGALAVASVLVALEVSATTAATPVERAAHIAPTVNRTLKSDRMPLAPAENRNTVNGPAGIKAPPITKPVLLLGCEPVVSAIGQPPLSKVAGRCLS
jgi:hypothetical protein